MTIITTPPKAPEDHATERWRSDSETIERRDAEHVEIVTSEEPAGIVDRPPADDRGTPRSEPETQSNRQPPADPTLPEGNR